MLTGSLRHQIDCVRDALWSGGIANPPEVIEQITYLLFVRRLDDIQSREDDRARLHKRPMERQILPEDGGELLRWSHFKDLEPTGMYEVVSNGGLPRLHTLDEGPTYRHHMEEARLTIEAWDFVGGSTR